MFLKYPIWVTLFVVFHGILPPGGLCLLGICHNTTTRPSPQSVFFRDSIYNTVPGRLQLNTTVGLLVHGTIAHIGKKPSYPTSIQKCRNAIPGDERLCTWGYSCDVDYDRIPPIMWQAQLKDPYHHEGKIQEMVAKSHLEECTCVPIVADVQILQFKSCSNNTERWITGVNSVAIGFTCAIMYPVKPNEVTAHLNNAQ